MGQTQSVNSKGPSQWNSILEKQYELHRQNYSIGTYSSNSKFQTFKKIEPSSSKQKHLKRAAQISKKYKTVAKNNKILFKERGLNDLQNIANNINYYEKRYQLLSRNQNSVSQFHNLIQVFSLQIVNKKTYKKIYPQPYNRINSQNNNQKHSMLDINCKFFEGSYESKRNNDSTSLVNSRKNAYEFNFIQQFFFNNLEKQILSRQQNQQYFTQKQIWSVLYCCAQTAKYMINFNLKEPMLSPASIFISESNEVKIGQWEFVNYFFKKQNQSYQQEVPQSTFIEEGQTILDFNLNSSVQFGNSKKRKQQKNILTSFYWPPQGIVQIHNMMQLGEFNEVDISNKNKQQSHQNKQKNNSQVFSLGMTLINMLTLKSYFQKRTFSQKQLKNILEECFQIRQKNGHPLSNDLKAILQKMISWDPLERSTFQQLSSYIQHLYQNGSDIFTSINEIKINDDFPMNGSNQFQQKYFQSTLACISDKHNYQKHNYQKKQSQKRIINKIHQKHNGKSMFTEMESQSNGRQQNHMSSRESSNQYTSISNQQVSKPVSRIKTNQLISKSFSDQFNQITFQGRINNQSARQYDAQGSGIIYQGKGDSYDPQPDTERYSQSCNQEIIDYNTSQTVKEMLKDNQDVSSFVQQIYSEQFENPDQGDEQQYSFQTQTQNEQNGGNQQTYYGNVKKNLDHNQFYNIQEEASQEGYSSERNLQAINSNRLNQNDAQNSQDSEQMAISKTFQSEENFNVLTENNNLHNFKKEKLESLSNRQNQPKYFCKNKKVSFGQNTILAKSRQSQPPKQLRKDEFKNLKHNVIINQQNIQANAIQSVRSHKGKKNFQVKMTTSPSHDQVKKTQFQQRKSSNLFTDPSILEMIKQFGCLRQNSENAFFCQTKQLKQRAQMNHSRSFTENNLRINHKNQNQEQLEYSKNRASQTSTSSNIFSKQNQSQSVIVKQQFTKGYYEGQKRNGVRNGFGTFYYRQGGKYCGYWYDNKMEGHGTLYYPDGRIAYQGQWKNDSLHGKGILNNQKPVSIKETYDFRSFDQCQNEECWVYYDGWFQNDEKQGFGQLIISNGQRYVGEFKNDMVHGKGKFYKLNGNIYQGYWQNNQLMQ